MEEKKPTAKKEIGAPEVPAERTFYANFAGFKVGLYDFIIDFGRSDFSGGVIEDSVIRIYFSPQHAKSLHMILGKQIQKYEERFGQIMLEEKKKDKKEG